MAEFSVIDADGHVREPLPKLAELLGPLGKRRALFPTDAWDRQLRGTLGQSPESPQQQLADMDQDGIDVMVLYPTAGLAIGLIAEEAYATALAAAYNTWLHSFCQANPARLKPVALLAPQDPEAAARELHRAVTELGAIGAMLPTHVPLRPDWGHRYWDPIYAEAQRLDVGLAFHHKSVHGELTDQRFHNFITVHTIGHPVEQMISLTSVIMGGVLERFPTLRLAFLEGGVGWVPYWMDRMDEEAEKRGAVEAPYLTMRPSEYVLSGRIFFGVECGEKTLPDAVRWGLEDTLLYSSDYPHWDGDWPHTVRTVRARADLSEDVKRKMLHDNAVRFYKLDEGSLPKARETEATASR
ncbi:MAG TPA: amidohydrolase family protein [Chloroflexota bacterium]|nr:amidohydrolase family protein [Chloroflexota bacterium]